MKILDNIKSQKTPLFLLALLVLIFHTRTWAQQTTTPSQQTILKNHIVISAKKIGSTVIEVLLSDNQRFIFDFYSDQIFRFFQDNSGGVMRDPEANPEAKILVNNPRKTVSKLALIDENNSIIISTSNIKIQIDKYDGLLKVINPANNIPILEQASPILFQKDNVTISLKEQTQEYFYGGGIQNGRFSHKGKTIAIENQNRWTDAGVASPAPFYWSTQGYGFMWHTFKKGKYDFGDKEKGLVRLSHETNYLDVFFMVGNGAVPLLNDYYQLTGNPVLLPKFGFYEGHLNAYNRDFWKEDTTGILFEDGKRYKESQKDNNGIKESLNGEKNNYQFSARGVIDRYKENDMPLGWLLPNDGYGAGYGQTETLDGNIKNLKDLGNYARKNGVEIGLWTQSDLHPKSEVSALLQRDILKEVKDAGVRVLKTDVAWVGAGYSFGLSGINDVAQIMSKFGNDARPFIISLDGWAGTQRYAAIWSGDQTGGVWEYIRFHIPTYLGAGLSGLPNIASDMDGIFGGKNPVVNTRDFQWKTFTPMQLNMDGWGLNEKYPQALSEPTTSINRNYLKLKSQLIPYTYSVARAAVNGLPIVRAMFLEYPNAYTYGSATKYQFFYGPNFIIAPIYQATKMDTKGNDIRNTIYLPPGIWIDYFTGETYSGNCILNNFNSPIWKLPVFVKSGSIIPMTNPNNNVSQIDNKHRIYEIYPYGKSSFTEYDDDGTTEQYKEGKGVYTLIESEVNKNGDEIIIIHPAKGDFTGLVKEKTTEFKINVTAKPKGLSAKIGNKEIKLAEVRSIDVFLRGDNVYFYDASPNLNKFATKGSDFEKVMITKNAQVLVKVSATDITMNQVRLRIKGFKFDPADKNRISSGSLAVPAHAGVTDNNIEPYVVKPTWQKVDHADYYELDFNGMRYTTIKDTSLAFEGLQAETGYSFKLRAVNKDGYSSWTDFNVTTKSNPLKFAIQGIVADTRAESQRSAGIDKLFDFEESDMWQTRRDVKSVPFDIIMDLKSLNQLDKFNYLPLHMGRGNVNGTLLKGKVFYSSSKEDWIEAGSFEWANSDEIKIFNFTDHPLARYLKITVTNGVGDIGSGRELYVFKVPGTESYLPGDINNDHLIDKNDLTAYMNYTGLRKGDADFEGYVSNGDINKNGLIDAFDISVVATQLDGGVDGGNIDKVSGKLEISTEKQEYNKDEVIEIKVKGIELKSVNALSFALPYSLQDYEFLGVKILNMNRMENLTYDRLHTSAEKALYPTFINIGNKEPLVGNMDLFLLMLKAKHKVIFNLKPINGYLVDKNLNTVIF